MHEATYSTSRTPDMSPYNFLVTIIVTMSQRHIIRLDSKHLWLCIHNVETIHKVHMCAHMHTMLAKRACVRYKMFEEYRSHHLSDRKQHSYTFPACLDSLSSILYEHASKMNGTHIHYNFLILLSTYLLFWTPLVHCGGRMDEVDFQLRWCRVEQYNLHRTKYSRLDVDH